MASVPGSNNANALARQLESLKVADCYDLSFKCTECDSEPYYQCVCNTKWCQQHYPDHQSTAKCQAGVLTTELPETWKTLLSSNATVLSTFYKQSYECIQ